MFAGITLQEGIVFEIFKNRTVLRDLLLVIVALALQFIQLLVELPYLDQVISTGPIPPTIYKSDAPGRDRGQAGTRSR